MQIIDKGVLLDASEFAAFFQEHCESTNFVYEVDDAVVGDITAITSDDRLVLSVDGVGTELYSNTMNVIAVVTSDFGYTVTFAS